jgi:FkbM family methyltransferase
MLKSLKKITYPARRYLAHSLCRSAIFPIHARLSFSASAEDLIALSWLRSAGVEPHHVRYLDIGAAEPDRINNTYLMAMSGGSGVLIEPDPDQAQRLRSARPMDTILNVGIAFDDRRRARLWRLTSRVYNTFLREQAEQVVEVSHKTWRVEQRQEIIDSVDVELVPVNSILSEYFDAGPHFISIDTEGTNFEIFRSIDFALYRPTVICVEADRPIGDYERLLSAHGYQYACGTPDNWIFRR